MTSTAEYNVAVGTTALDAITTGDYNTAIGYDALSSNTTGYRNSASGTFALFRNITGYENTATGYDALTGKTTSGNMNTASGYRASRYNTTGELNTAVGFNAYIQTPLVIVTAVGSMLYITKPKMRRTQLWDIRLEMLSLLGLIMYLLDMMLTLVPNDAVNQIVIGYNATGTGDTEIALGNTSITAIKAQVTSITGYSDERIKREISDNTLGLEFIKKLETSKI